MSTGIELIDQQHKMLFEKFNEFSGAINKLEARLAAGEILDFLQFYAMWHFEQEEKEMEKYKCSFAELNKKAHKQFAETFGLFYLEWQEGNMTKTIVEKTHQEMENWLVDHIMMIDSQLLLFVRNSERKD